MRLKVVLPTAILVDEPVSKIVAEAENGSFCLLPRHADFVTALAPGVLVFVTARGAEEFLGLDGGTLIKCGREVLVSTRDAVRGEALDRLRAIIRHEFLDLDEREREARVALARLESSVLRRFIELEEKRP